MEKKAASSRGNRDDATTPSPTRRTYDASRRQADAVERRRRVVDAAEELFLTVGYGATSINEIARLADVSPQMIYASFGSKAGVLAKLADIVVAGDDAALHDGDAPLVRDRHSDIDDLESTDLRLRFRAIGHYAAVGHGRSANVLRLIDSVAGTDDAVAELQSGLLTGLREDLTLAVSAMPWDQLRPGLEPTTVVDLLVMLLGWRGYVSLVLESGWTAEQYTAGIADTLIHLLLPDETP
jgi:AcrR family transcriptional regulator